ncbi:MAG: amino acid ABC transporter permease [Stackebrandtia sp.]
MSSQQSTVLFDALGPRGRKRVAIMSVISAVVILGALGYATFYLGQKDFFSGAAWANVFDALVVQKIWIPALLSTIKAAVFGMIGAVVLGVIIGMGRVSRFKTLRAITAVYVQFFRALPVLLLMWIPYTVNLFLGFLDPIMSKGNSSLFFVAAGLTIYNAAILAEILRSGINALPPGQAMAGHAVGLRHGQVMRSVVMPQAVRNMLPAVLAQMVILLKDTALGYTIAYPELLHEAQTLGKTYDAYLQMLVTGAAGYFLLAFALSQLVKYLDRRMSRKTAAKKTVAAEIDPAGGMINT